MTYRHRARSLAALLMAAFVLAAPLTALAKKGEKNYRKGLEYEQAQQWEKAAQEFALAVAARPSDTEYQLHYRRAIFNASQVFMQKGRALAEAGDYVGAYNAFRTAYGYDNVNELAANEMQRVLRLQRERDGTAEEKKDGARVSPTSYRGGGANGVAGPDAQNPRVEQLKNVNYSGELEPFIRSLADELNLNVIFDQNFAQVKRTINVRLKDVTAARTLDYIFQAYGLFFQRLDRRTILVADQSKRPVYQQLVLRTFYLNNIPTNEARQMIQAALPANAGRQPQVVENKTTNSITVRDTPENMRIIADLIQGIDKDRAEVVMEVSIYEVSRTDLLQVGNQFGTAETLANLGGLQLGSILFEGAKRIPLPGSTTGATVPVSMGVGLLIPASALSLLQGRNNTRLVFSTQVHAFDDEKSETRIGQKVPVQTASVFSGITTAPAQGSGGANSTTGVFGNGFPVIQYEDTGLVLDFTPKVFPNQDVQVKMNIETKDVGAGPDPLTPSFTQRKISGVARIPNGRTMMIASVGSDRQSEGRTSLPLLGLIPVLGRIFTAPRRDNIQQDVVITMTPRVLRAPQILPEDEIPKPSGSMQTPTTESLEAMLRDADREDQLARAVTTGRSLPTSQQVQLPAPPGEEVGYVPAPKALAAAAASNAASNVSGTVDATRPQAITVSLTNAAATQGPVVVPAADDAAPPVPARASNANGSNGVAALTREVINAAVPAESAAELLLLPEQQEAKPGEKRRVMVFMKTDAPVGLVTATLRFDPKVMAVRAVSQGMLSADKATAPNVTHSVDPSGVLVVSVAPAAGAAPLTGEGLLLIIEVEALAAGEGTLSFDAGKVHLIATDGRTVRAKATASRIKVTQ